MNFALYFTWTSGRAHGFFSNASFSPISRNMLYCFPGECTLDDGNYFITSGSQKTVIVEECTTENHTKS